MSSDAFLKTEIMFLKGVGPQRAELLTQELGLRTYNDLIHYFPFRYVDKSSFTTVRESFAITGPVQMKGTITKVSEVGSGRKKRLTAVFTDETASIDLVWFTGVKWVKPILQADVEFTLFGKVTRFGAKYNIAHPEVELYEKTLSRVGNLQPVYNSGEKLSAKGLHTKGLEKILRTLIALIPSKIHRTLSEGIIQQYNLMDREEAFRQIHFPESNELLLKAQMRLKFEELFFMQMALIKQKLITQRKTRGFVFAAVGIHFNTFYNNHLPFELTGAQKRVVKEIRRDTATGHHMNRLLQGDVGSGKTLVAILSMLVALDNGFQACMVAPTEILANQHLQSALELLGPMGVKIGILTGSSKTAERRVIHESLEDGSLQILIGTHAILEEKVRFKNLGIAIVDEQHKFGVAQRSKLWKKNVQPPHILVMTATPIPRTLAMTFYGDLDVSVIDELPPGRKEIRTIHYFDSKRLLLFQFLEDEIKKGRQVYVVYPLIEESETLDYKDLMDGYESISRRFPRPDYQISIVHGRMKPADKDYEMNLFAEGKTQILVATTVIEVGVNVPNASVMVIESAEKFGLSTLHQLRGRVGRGAEQSFCVLMTGYKLSQEAKIRMETMVRTSDGFEIAEVDLRMRGPGDIMGTQQSGILDLKIADLAKDSQLLNLARICATELLEEDPDITHKKNLDIRQELMLQMKRKSHWSRIS
jgi:ATP-dependent DNA helicase RecG